MPAKRLTRPTGDRVFLGVCSGIAEYFGVDPTIVRLLFVLAIFAGGASPLAYIVLAIVMPSADARPGGGASTATPAAPPAVAEAAAPAAPRSSTLGEDVVETVETAIERATKDPGQTAS